MAAEIKWREVDAETFADHIRGRVIDCPWEERDVEEGAMVGLRFTDGTIAAAKSGDGGGLGCPTCGYGSSVGAPSFWIGESWPGEEDKDGEKSAW